MPGCDPASWDERPWVALLSAGSKSQTKSQRPQTLALGYIERRYAMARAYLDSPPVRLLDAA